MAWLGSTLGDGLTSLKGQITKITKDVLAEDPLGSTSFEGRIKELEEMCESQALENKKLREENVSLKSNKSFEWSDDQFQDVCALETQISELTSEKNRLEKLIEGYDADYQKELETVVKDRDYWKGIAQKNGSLPNIRSSNRLDDLTTVMNKVELQNATLLEELEYYKTEVARLKGDDCVTHRELCVEGNRVLNQNSAVKKQALENVSLMTGDTKKLEEELRTCRTIIEGKDAKINENAEEMVRMRNDTLRLSNEKNALDSDNASLMTEKAELEMMVQHLKESVDELQCNLRNERLSAHELNAKNAELISLLENLQLERKVADSSLLPVNESMQGEHVRGTANLASKFKVVEAGVVKDHCQCIGSIDKLKEEKTLLAHKCEELLEEISCIKKQHESLLHSFEEEKDRAAKSVAMSDSYRNDINSLQRTLGSTRSELLQAQASLDEARLIYEALTKENELLVSDQESQDSSKIIAQENALKSENASLKETLLHLQTLNKDCEIRLQESRSATETLKTENAQLKSAIEDLKACSASKEEIDRLTEELNNFHDHIKSLSTELKEKDYQLKQFSQGTGKLAQENTELAKKLKEFANRDETDRLILQVASLQGQIVSLSAASDEKDKQLKQLCLEVQRLSQEKSELLNQSRERSDVEIGRLTAEIATLQTNLAVINEEKDQQTMHFTEEMQKLTQENRELARQLNELNVHLAGKVPVASDWMNALEKEVVLLARCVNAPLPEPINLVICLQEANAKISHLLTAGNNTLGPEIRKLKILVNRIRREFMLTAAERDQQDAAHADSEFSDEQGDNLVIQSQTDDVKSVKQDIAQMTEILGMIDGGLTSVLQDKSRLEKEIAILLSLSSKTGKELDSATKARDSCHEEKKQLAELLRLKEVDLELSDSAKRAAELEVAVAKSNALEIEKGLLSVLEEKNNLVAQVKNLEECLNQDKLLKEKILRLQSFSKEQAEEIEQLKQNCGISSVPEPKVVSGDDEDFESIAGEMEAKCQLLEKKCEEIEEKSSVTVSHEEKDNLEDMISRLQQENTDLKNLVQQLRETIFAMGSKADSEESKDHSQQHRRTLSQTTMQSSEVLRAELQHEQARQKTLQLEHQALLTKEASLLKELERLRKHLVEVEEHYTTEAVVAEQAINEYRSKLASAEDQLRNSSTVYKSANVRSTQHLEALQNQIRLMSVQRDDLQAKLSVAEDQMQKQSAALASLQMVLEQFQLDKERELKAAASKYEYQLHLSGRRCVELEAEIKALEEQLAEAKNGLKAAVRLGQQLDRKSEQVSALEKELEKERTELSEANKRLAAANESTNAKVDKFLVKNLILGYLSAGQGHTKAQALKILATVLGLSEEERAKVGVDNQTGWFSHLLHPSPGGSSSSEPLSQAFIRFLESESRPQPQLKLLPEASANLSTNTPKRPPLVLSDLVLPTVTPTQLSDKTGSALNDVLRES